MNTQELEAFMQAQGVPRGMYAIGADVNESYCVVPEANSWLVYYSERGHRNDLQTYASEHDACIDLMERVTQQVERDSAW